MNQVTSEARDDARAREMLRFNLPAEIAQLAQHKPWQSGVYSRLLLKTSDIRLLLVSMEAGARMKEHHADGAVSVHVLEGALRLHGGERTEELRAGELLALPPSLRHDVEAVAPCSFLLTISWPSSEKLKSMTHRGYGS